jgi:hypothetical protein
MDVAVCKEGVVLKEHQLCVENTEEGFRAMMTWLVGCSKFDSKTYLRCEFLSSFNGF